MDKALIRKRFARAAGSYCGQAEVQRQVACRLSALIGRYIPAGCFRRVLEVGCGTGLFTRVFLAGHRPEFLLLNDICPEVEPYLPCRSDGSVCFLPGDAEATCFPAGQDLVVSCSAVQWFERPGDFLSGCHRLLKGGAWLAFSSFGRENLAEVSALTGVSLPYPSPESLQAVLAKHFSIVCVEEETVTMSFASPLEVLKHLQGTGVTGVRPHAWTRASLERFSTGYRALYGQADGTVPLTYRPFYMICKRKPVME